MSFSIWMGTEEAHGTLAAFEKKFSTEIQAFRDDDDDDITLDKNFNVMTDRKGLSIMERFGDKAVIKVHGSLTNSYSWWHSMFPGQVTSYEAIKDALAIAGNEQGISQVYLDFATGGGVVRGLDTASEMIKRVNSVKPVYAHTDSHSFSAGYWLASTARSVTASRMAEVGSIGTLIVLENYAEAAEKQGVKYHVFRAGEYKALGLPYEELTEEAAAYIQANLDKTNKFFLEHVSRNRNLMMSDRQQWAEGKTFFAEEAMSVGLVDRITTLADLIGSGASTPITSDTRRFEMNISAEKLAQIAAGADPTVVLTAEELIHYQASLAEEPAEEAEPEAKADDEPATPALGVDTVALLKENGKLEAKLEAAEAKMAEMALAVDAANAQATALITVAQAAVANLQKALGAQKEVKSTAAEVVSQYTELQGKMAARFPVGQQTQTPTEDTTRAQVERSFRH